MNCPNCEIEMKKVSERIGFNEEGFAARKYYKCNNCFARLRVEYDFWMPMEETADDNLDDDSQ